MMDSLHTDGGGVFSVELYQLRRLNNSTQQLVDVLQLLICQNLCFDGHRVIQVVVKFDMRLYADAGRSVGDQCADARPG